MRPRRLVLRPRAIRDIDRQAAYLEGVRGVAFAERWREDLITWLVRHAASGAQYGTAHPRLTRYRTFGYKRQATILAEFADGEMDVVRISFAGQDWQA
jgi:plasmid stabilization system protein ParE